MTRRIREATPDDVELIVELIRGLADYERLAHQVEATPDRLRATLFPHTVGSHQSPAAYCVIGEIDGRAAGFALYFFNYSTFLARPGLYLEDLFVKPEWRGRGLGKALLLHLAGIARDRGCGRMEWAVLDWNQPALDFYESVGATRLREWQLCRLTASDLQRLASDAYP
jgi:GNAT superfamily N-acetyltransferase